jgi:predicted RNA-binding Zn-ribbon protein involved in translation (DUF1610 family)
MRKAEYEQRMSDYSRRLGERERSALTVFLPLLSVLIVTPFAIPGLLPRSAFVGVILALLALLAGSAVWIAVRAWRRDRSEGIVAPCPACGAELAMLYDEVIVAGLCPRCGERAISDAV